MIRLLCYILVQVLSLLVLAWLAYIIFSIVLMLFGVETYLVYFIRVIGASGRIALGVSFSVMCLILYLFIENYWKNR